MKSTAIATLAIICALGCSAQVKLEGRDQVTTGDEKDVSKSAPETKEEAADKKTTQDAAVESTQESNDEVADVPVSIGGTFLVCVIEDDATDKEKSEATCFARKTKAAQATPGISLTNPVESLLAPSDAAKEIKSVKSWVAYQGHDRKRITPTFENGERNEFKFVIDQDLAKDKPVTIYADITFIDDSEDKEIKTTLQDLRVRNQPSSSPVTDAVSSANTAEHQVYINNFNLSVGDDQRRCISVVNVEPQGAEASYLIEFEDQGKFSVELEGIECLSKEFNNPVSNVTLEGRFSESSSKSTNKYDLNANEIRPDEVVTAFKDINIFRGSAKLVFSSGKRNRREYDNFLVRKLKITSTVKFKFTNEHGAKKEIESQALDSKEQ